MIRIRRSGSYTPDNPIAKKSAQVSNVRTVECLVWNNLDVSDNHKGKMKEMKRQRFMGIKFLGLVSPVSNNYVYDREKTPH